MLPQPSALLQLPLELRHEVYSYILPAQIHIRLEDNRLTLSMCMQPDKDKYSTASVQKFGGVPHDGYERKPYDPSVFQHASRLVWARRLRSTWGPHWTCEERLTKEPKEDGIGNDLGPVGLLLVCRTMYKESIEFMLHRVVVNITDLATLMRMCNEAAGHVRPIILQQGVRHLSLTLRMPLDFYKSLETQTEKTTITPSEIQQEPIAAHTWAQLRSMLDKLTTLSTLRLWFDHSDTCSWSFVNERALLSSILTYLSATAITTTIILLRLHPVYESPDRHFTTDELGKNLYLYRKLRQRWYSEVDRSGDVDVVHKPDFPIAIDAFDDMTIVEAEMWERKHWREGRDVEAMVRELTEPSNQNIMI